jgi:hypothetical protein
MVKTLSAILLLSDYLAAYLFYLAGGCSVDSEEEWVKLNNKVVVELGIELDDIKDLKSEAEDTLFNVDEH